MDIAGLCITAGSDHIFNNKRLRVDDIYPVYDHYHTINDHLYYFKAATYEKIALKVFFMIFSASIPYVKCKLNFHQKLRLIKEN